MNGAADTGRVYAVGAAARWDARRNTSGVTPPPPDALPNALAALDRLHYDQPALVAWIMDGAPTMTEAEHVQRFGEPYDGGASTRRRSAGAVVEPVGPRAGDAATDGPAPAARAHSPEPVDVGDRAAKSPFVAPAGLGTHGDGVQHRGREHTPEPTGQLDLGAGTC